MILVAVGANLPDAAARPPALAARAGAEALRGLAGLRLAAVSRWYRTAPVPPSAQPDYINGVVRLEGQVEPVELLRRLNAIEAAAGRVRTARGAARPLDLDIIDLNGLVRAAPDPVLPHPRAHLRPFVLVPLLDVAPDWVHPGLGMTAAALLAALPPAQVTPM